MAPNRIRRRASSNPGTGHQGLPRRHGHHISLSLPKSPRILACPACRLDTGDGHPMLMLRDKTEQRDGRVNDDDMRVSGTRAIARLSRLRCVTGPGLGSARE